MIVEVLWNRLAAGSQNRSGSSVLSTSRWFANDSADPAKEIHDIIGGKPSDAAASGGPQPENVAPSTQMHVEVTTGACPTGHKLKTGSAHLLYMYLVYVWRVRKLCSTCP